VTQLQDSYVIIIIIIIIIIIPNSVYSLWIFCVTILNLYFYV